ncbi:MAG TPA: HAMP domain-containing sensor histidine kinase [Candidatus Limnocylindrales bacterium]|nr:HAMP domain-containing sensor histidine kinase [Candidatus Limnocylindrales bacterium]
MTTPQPPPASAERWLGVVRWLLPLGLAVIAVVIEWSEHVASDEEAITPAFFGEVFLFAVVGPVAVALTLRWMAQIIGGYRATAAALESMNRSLEAKVAERTRHLEEATAKLAAANDNLRQLDRMKSEFVSLVSHQLRAPLTNIHGALEIVAEDAELLPPASRRTLQILTLESDRLSGLIQTILDVSRIESGRLTLRLGPVAVEPLLARSCAASLEAEPGRPLSFDVPVALPPAWADETLAEEVVRNIVENAVRYSPADSPIEVSAHARDDRIEIAVADHGPGVPASEQDQIFSSFYRLGDTETTTSGYGLGLYFADKLVRAQQGEIAVESPVWPDEDHPGTRFIVTLPIAPPDPDDPDWGRPPGVGEPRPSSPVPGGA